MPLLEELQKAIDELLDQEESRIEEIDQFRLSAFSWWKAIENTFKLYAGSMKTEIALRKLLRTQKIEIDNLNKIIDMLRGGHGESFGKKDKEEKK